MCKCSNISILIILYMKHYTFIVKNYVYLLFVISKNTTKINNIFSSLYDFLNLLISNKLFNRLYKSFLAPLGKTKTFCQILLLNRRYNLASIVFFYLLLINRRFFYIPYLIYYCDYISNQKDRLLIIKIFTLNRLSILLKEKLANRIRLFVGNKKIKFAFFSDFTLSSGLKIKWSNYLLDFSDKVKIYNLYKIFKIEI